eukprot:2871022-Amphidinium_carterae.1
MAVGMASHAVALAERRAASSKKAGVISDAASAQVAPHFSTTPFAREVELKVFEVVSVTGSKQEDFTCLAMLIARAIAQDSLSETSALSCVISMLMSAGTIADFAQLNATLAAAEMRVSVRRIPSGSLDAMLTFLRDQQENDGIKSMDDMEKCLLSGNEKAVEDRTELEKACIESYKIIEVLLLCGIPIEVVFTEALDRGLPEHADVAVMLAIISDAKSSVNSTSYGAYMRKRVTALGRATNTEFPDGLFPSYAFSSVVSSKSRYTSSIRTIALSIVGAYSSSNIDRTKALGRITGDYLKFTGMTCSALVMKFLALESPEILSLP